MTEGIKRGVLQDTSIIEKEIRSTLESFEVDYLMSRIETFGSDYELLVKELTNIIKEL